MHSKLALIIEDDDDAAQIFARALQAEDMQIEIINTGDDAMNRLNEIKPDLIVLDLHIPNIIGTDLLEWIRATPALEDTRVLVITADERLGETIEDMADMMLTKPATFSQIRSATQQLSQI